MRQEITEEQGIHKEWYEQTKEQTIETLPDFIKKLMNDYEHDYGTIVHAMTAAAIGSINVINKSDQGGITGFQAGCLMWEFIRNFMKLDGPMTLRQYNDMLYPQYQSKFEKTISKETHEYLIEKAKELLEKKQEIGPSERVLNHWQTIAMGIVPFGYSVIDED